jgi:hypothetical protein
VETNIQAVSPSLILDGSPADSWANTGAATRASQTGANSKRFKMDLLLCIFGGGYPFQAVANGNLEKGKAKQWRAQKSLVTSARTETGRLLSKRYACPRSLRRGWKQVLMSKGLTSRQKPGCSDGSRSIDAQRIGGFAFFLGTNQIGSGPIVKEEFALPAGIKNAKI